MILDIYKDSFVYSFKEPLAIFKLGVLSLLSFLVVPYFLYCGYYYRIVRIGVNGMINGDDPLPEFKNWEILLIEGIKIFVVRLVYFIPVIIVFTLGFVIFILYSISSYHIGEVPDFPTMFILFGVISISILVWLILYLFSNVAIPHMINKESFLSAFKINEIIAIIKSIGVYKYLQFYTGCMVILLGIISTTLLFLTLISLFFGLLLSSALGPLAMAFSGIFIGITSSIILFFILYPFFMIFEGRSIALMYNTREN